MYLYIERRLKKVRRVRRRFKRQYYRKWRKRLRANKERDVLRWKLNKKKNKLKKKSFFLGKQLLSWREPVRFKKNNYRLFILNHTPALTRVGHLLLSAGAVDARHIIENFFADHYKKFVFFKSSALARFDVEKKQSKRRFKPRKKKRWKKRVWRAGALRKYILFRHRFLAAHRPAPINDRRRFIRIKSKSN